MISKAFVYIDGLEDKPVICGVVSLDDQKKIGHFRYGTSYLNRADAFPLDPVNLPLGSEEFSTRNMKGLFGALSDAGADSWGEKVILSIHAKVPQNKIEFLLAGAGMGVGALMFSGSRTASKPKKSKNSIGELPLLIQGKKAILSDESISDEAKKAFEYGASMGGARPKTTVADKGVDYLVKFNRAGDIFNHAKVEHATMRMLDELSCVRVAKTRVIETADEDVLLVKRFDLDSARPTHHFLSAHSIFNYEKVRESMASTSYSYGAFAEFILRHSKDPADATDLFCRMSFNVLMGNTDDHSRNHAMLYSFDKKNWRLSPAYDVLPINSGKEHGIGIGDEGRLASMSNLMSQHARFALTAAKAKKLISEVVELTKSWPDYFSRQGVGEGDITRLRNIIPNIK